jgi:hypothetical protein
MAFQHYMPASFLARFSSETETEPKRKRALWVLNKRTKNLFCANAGSICGVNDMFAVGQPHDPNLVDQMWSGYEPRLYDALDALIARRLDALEWLRTLVPFVSALFVRGMDFDNRFNSRLESFAPGLAEKLSPDNINFARLMEWQRLRPAMISASWDVLEMRGILASSPPIWPMPRFSTAQRAKRG